MKLRNQLAIAAAKTASALSRMVGKQGQNLPGTVGLKLSPSLLHDLSHQVREKTVMVCGTNGKTTTNNLLAQLCQKAGYKVICNYSGANMRDGIAGSFILASRAGKIDCDIACLESDEAWARRSIVDLPVDLMLVTNLFRDQLDRYGEIDTTIDYLLQAIARKPGIRLLVNGDDALAVSLAIKSGQPFVSFGVEDEVLDHQEHETREATYCPMCNQLLHYDFYHFSQLGHYHCSCGFKRPAIDYKISQVDLTDGLAFDLNGQKYQLDYRGFYNIYNVAAALAAYDWMELRQTDLAKSVAEFRPKAGRNQEFQIGPTQLILNLAKNPAGFNQNIHTLLTDSDRKSILIGINDNDQDGKDISWLWDVTFDQLQGEQVERILTTGSRAGDMALRLKYDGIPATVVPGLETAIQELLSDKPAKAYVLVNYTLLDSAHAILTGLAGSKA